MVVLSADEYNERTGWAYCAPIVRRPASGELSPYAVPLTDPDPVSGVVVADAIEYVHLSAGTERVGVVTGATFARVESAFRTVFEL